MNEHDLLPPEPRTIRLLLEYDGGLFAGFQKQPIATTVQNTLDTLLSQILGEGVSTIGAGRTDTGVHAAGQVVHFTTRSPLALGRLQWSFNCLARPGLAILQAQEVPASFHARYSARWRQYRYRLLLGQAPSPLRQRYAYWPGTLPMDVAAVERVWASLIGTRDFTPWQNSGSETDHPTCTVLAASTERQGDELHFVLRANRFLYRMVRNLVGSAVRVGQGKLSEADFAHMLDTGQGKGGPAVPPEGLCFEAVGYEIEWP